MEKNIKIDGIRFRWRETDCKYCDVCVLENTRKCPIECNQDGYYSMLTEEEAEFEEKREFYKTHPNFCKSNRDIINKKYNL